MSLTVTGTDPTSCTEMKVLGGRMMERSTEGECGQVLEARQVKPRLGVQRGLITLLNLQRWVAPPVLKLKTRSAEVKASRQPLLGAAAMDGSATPIHTEEGRLAKRPPPSKGGLGWS